MAETFKITKRSREPIEFDIEGDDYTYVFTPPKTATAVLPVLDGEASEIKATLNWLSDGLPEEQNTHLINRLKDPKDDLDLEDVGGYVERLMEIMAARPTS